MDGLNGEQPPAHRPAGSIPPILGYYHPIAASRLNTSPFLSAIFDRKHDNLPAGFDATLATKCQSAFFPELLRCAVRLDSFIHKKHRATLTSAVKNGGGANRPPRRAPGGCKQGIPASFPWQESALNHRQPYYAFQGRRGNLLSTLSTTRSFKKQN